jgi:hypothetical protein
MTDRPKRAPPVIDLIDLVKPRHRKSSHVCLSSVYLPPA